MNLATNLMGRLQNTVLPKTHALLPVFEAVVNSIHAIEESGKTSKNGKITIEIIRLSSQGQKRLFDEEKKRGPEALPVKIVFATRRAKTVAIQRSA